jgi:CheY-like chemotaxis protein
LLAGHLLYPKASMEVHPTILIAEDIESDRTLIRLGFEKAHFPFHLQFVEDGVQAVRYLQGSGPYANRAKFPVPAILLTDLKMPRMGGFELLAWVRKQKKWKNLPVIVITGSNQGEDRKRAVELGANSYVVKDLLMRPPPELFDDILRHTSPQKTDTRKAWAQRVKGMKKSREHD